MSFITYTYGAWNPLLWLAVLLVLGALVLIFRSRAPKRFRRQKSRGDAFISGNATESAEKIHVPAHNIYWGFFEALKGFFTAVTRPHTGIINDYVLWLVGIAGLLLLLILLAG